MKRFIPYVRGGRVPVPVVGRRRGGRGFGGFRGGGFGGFGGYGGGFQLGGFSGGNRSGGFGGSIPAHRSFGGYSGFRGGAVGAPTTAPGPAHRGGSVNVEGPRGSRTGATAASPPAAAAR